MMVHIFLVKSSKHVPKTHKKNNDTIRCTTKIHDLNYVK